MGMKRFCLSVAIVCLSALPMQAEESNMDEGLSLLEQGARLFMKGLAEEMEPALRDLSTAVEPAIAELLGLIDDINAYELPERLPNGDIIIRRKPDHALPDTDETDIEI